MVTPSPVCFFITQSIQIFNALFAISPELRKHLQHSMYP
ncbi:hypothetical protein ECP03052607_4149 [Escherichia coli P0305260.7]|nr:hypothetical protein CSC22_0111 [Escherichia coli]EHV33735.1 hypothetical protein ECDEC5D_4800 [Escherichia coli DEC5D]ENF86680.1 hypothetical protein ECP030526013_4131 [Escherichia coli P0305260.13]ENG13022.1 hypothetical protein ECP03052607_4149 [Escherichia coli P0305260.7]ENG22611.1 hypothetical protein ECP03052608_4115 [Escherichia coli P0305260.8]CCP95645.1 hypothetical protein ECK5_11630 [Escherichia coli O10:K5(L):H4 str. ATCC 23506]